ncbi:hypothetical protein D3C73_1159960 [compost metagenome]
MRVGQAQHLHLRAHQGARAGRFKAAAFARQLGHVGRRRHHRRLFNRHRHQHVAAIDLEVARHAQRQFECADDVFDHAVGAVQSQRAGLGQQLLFIGGQRGGLGNGGQALCGGQRAEVG